MDLSQLANLGEFIGGVAVLVTLVYLAVQVRGNAQSVKAESHRAYVAEWNRTFWGPFREVENANLMRRAIRDYDSLDASEKLVACSWFFGTMNLGQELLALRESASIDDDYAANAEGAIAAFVQMRGVAQWWEKVGPLYGTTFHSRVDELLASPSCPPPFSDFVPAFLGVDTVKEQSS